MNNIIVTGFMASGKTTVSKELSRLMSKILIDTDDEIVKRLDTSIVDIFDKFGEEYFRKKETEILKTVLRSTDAVISTGGGIVLKQENRRLMKESGIVISLIPDFSVIESRLSSARKTRPLLMEETEKIKKRYYDRLPLYRDCDIEINPSPDETPAETAKHILERIDGCASYLHR